MAKKIRNVKLQEEDIKLNSGKNISHTINKIKAHERFYTTILVLIFMVVISLSIYLGLRVTPNYDYVDNIDYIDNTSGFSYTSKLVYLNQKNIGNNIDSSYNLTLSNMTNNNINYLIKIVLDEDARNECNCEDKLITFDKLRYSLEDNIERSFNSSDMVITTGFIHPLEREDLPIKIWITDELDQNSDISFYGKIVLEKIEE